MPNKRILLLAIFLCAIVVLATSEETGKIDPIFPEEQSSLIFVEGENAVSTNFAAEPILNYACSGERSLQLNKSIQAPIEYYAEYVFLVSEGGSYELWYGGTPPGPKDALYPSYSSPFSYSINEGPAVPVYRENVNVVENYGPSYYWCRVGAIKLSQGLTTIKFSVGEKRRFDGRYAFYLDNFFLIKVTNGKTVPINQKPEVFPQNMDYRGIDFPFKSLEDYQIAIRDDPNNKQALLNISRAYSLVGDYLNALKNLRRVLLLDPSNEEALLLYAKNLMWKGDINEGLQGYRELIEKYPDRKRYYLEAGKVAAWAGKYAESETFYVIGLVRFPGDLDLIINLGLTELWASQESSAKQRFAEVEASAKEEQGLLIKIASIFSANGYPDLAIPILKRVIELYPAFIETYFTLQDLYVKMGKEEEAKGVATLMEARFIPSAQLSDYVATQGQKLELRDQLIAKYKKALETDPDNLGLREVLAQTYFWNGMEEEATQEYLNILTTMAYKNQAKYDEENSQVLEILAVSAIDKAELRTLLAQLELESSSLSQVIGKLRAAEKTLNDYRAAVEKAKAEGKQYVLPTGSDPEGEYQKAKESLSGEYAKAKALLARIEYVIQANAGSRSGTDAILLADKEAKENYAALWRNGWYFDRDSFIDEEQKVSRSGLYLGSYLLFRLYQGEGDATKAQGAAKNFQAKETLNPDILYSLAQDRLLAGDMEGAKYYLERLKALSAQPKQYKAVSGRFDSQAAYGQAQYAFEEADASAIESLLASFGSLRERISSSISGIDSDSARLATLLHDRLIRMYYSIESESASLRNELASYYLKGKKLDEAATQLRSVLRVDPNDTQARYLLGTVYQWRGQWDLAMSEFKSVYLADPTNQSALSFYNALANQHADLFGASASMQFDTGGSDAHAQILYQAKLNESLGLELNYNFDSLNRRFDFQGISYAQSFELYDLRAAVNIASLSGLTISPYIGVIASGNAILRDPSAYSALPVAGFPVLGATLDLRLGDASRLFASYRLGPNQESIGLPGEPPTSNQVEINLAGDPGFLGNALSFLGFRLYGMGEMLSDGAIFFTALGEINLFMVHGGSPYTLFYLTLGYTYQDSPVDPTVAARYWLPNQISVALGTLGYSTWIGFQGGKVLGIIAQAKCGVYVEQSFTSPLVYLNGVFYLGLEYSSDLMTLSIATELSGTHNLQLDWTSQLFSYYSLYLKLGVNVKLPDYIVPKS